MELEFFEAITHCSLLLWGSQEFLSSIENYPLHTVGNFNKLASLWQKTCWYQSWDRHELLCAAFRLCVDLWISISYAEPFKWQQFHRVFKQVQWNLVCFLTKPFLQSPFPWSSQANSHAGSHNIAQSSSWILPSTMALLVHAIWLHPNLGNSYKGNSPKRFGANLVYNRGG